MKKKSIKDKYAGRFFTPSYYSSLTHQRISSALGDSWTQDYVVWDCACGEKSLTKDLKFKELYCSTLEQWELDNSSCYNTEGTSFQFDFLNDYIPSNDELFSNEECKLPAQLIKSLNEKKPILFLINPPYGTSGEFTKDGAHKAEIAKNKINEMMKSEGYGGSASNLFSQFLYRIMKIKQDFDIQDVKVCMFTTSIFLSGPKFKSFRKHWFDTFKMIDGGFLMSAGEFAGCSSMWSICFSMWQSGVQKERDIFEFDITESENGVIKVEGKNRIWNTDNKIPASDWVREPIRGYKTVDVPQLSSACNVKQDGRGRMIEGGCVGYMQSAGNYVLKNEESIGLYSSSFSNGNGVPIQMESLGYMANTANCVLQNEQKCGLYSSTHSTGNANAGLTITPEPLPLGYFHNDSNCVEKNEESVSLYSSSFSDGNGVPVQMESLGYMQSAANCVQKNQETVGLYSSGVRFREGFTIIPEPLGYMNNAGNCVEKNEETCGLYSSTHSQGNANAGFTIIPEPLGYFHNDSNCVETNEESVALFSSGRHNAAGLTITPEPLPLGYFNNHSNCVEKNEESIALFSSGRHSAEGLTTTSGNFSRCVALFAARKSVHNSWLRCFNEYMRPNTDDPLYPIFVSNAVVFSIFNNSSQQSDLYNVEYKGKKWFIRNEWYWMPLPDLDFNHQPYIYKYLYLHYDELLDVSKQILKLANEMDLFCRPFRKEWQSKNDPKYQVCNARASYYQQHWMWQEYCPDKFKEFRKLYKILENEMNKETYRLGFLMN